MAAYTEYTESESDIQNDDLLYKTLQKHQNTLEILVFWWKVEKSKIAFLFCYIYKFHNSYFVIFGISINFKIYVYSVYLYIVEGHTA